MKKFSLSDTVIAVGESIQNLAQYCEGDKTIFVVDSNIDFFPGIKIPGGEASKTLQSVETLYKHFIEEKVTRYSCIVGIGGGAICDLVGYAASTYMRGISFGFVPTTLLAQVDASIGGKNGVNFQGYKNFIGTISQPKFVLSDYKWLKSLSIQELKNGFAEIIKHAFIADSQYLDFLEQNCEKALTLDSEVLEEMIYRSVEIKMNVVAEDEKDKNKRHILNFGHTLAHALEKEQDITHGEAVSIGMVWAVKISQKKGYLSQEVVIRLEELLERFKLPIRTTIQKEKIFEAMVYDKKCEREYINFVLLKDLGQPFVTSLSMEEIRGYLDEMC